jgi:hypothetical protein
MIPTIKDLVMYVNKALDSVAWNTNFQKIVNWLTSGNYDIKVKNLEISEGGGITNNGSLTQSGNLAVTGDVSATGNLTVGGVISGDGSGLTGVISAAQISYTPFCVNSGNINSANGNPDILDYTGGTLKFKVGGTVPAYDKIKATTAQGVTFELDQILDLDVSTQIDGTYIVCVKRNQTVAELKMGLYRQPYAPTDGTIPNNSIWLDTSKEGLKCFEKVSTNWNTEYDGVPIGKVTISSGAITAVENFKFNWNGYNVNIGDCINLQTNQYPRVVVKTWDSGTSWYRIYSDGWIEQGGQGASANNWVTLFVVMKNTNYSAIAVNRATAAYEAVTTDRSDNLREKTRFYVGQSSHSAPFTWEVRGYGEF